MDEFGEDWSFQDEFDLICEDELEGLDDVGGWEDE